jgi:hypothetical protein
MAQEHTASTTMAATRSELLPWLSAGDQECIFTFSKMVVFSNLLHDLSDHISVTWNVQLDPDDLSLRYSDLTGDVVDLDSLYSVLGTLQPFCPEWCRRQDDGFNSYLFTDLTQPYIMRLTSCHQKDPSVILP